jgi:hypothetical protein
MVILISPSSTSGAIAIHALVKWLHALIFSQSLGQGQLSLQMPDAQAWEGVAVLAIAALASLFWLF